MALPEPVHRLWRWQFGRFLFVGGINTAFGYGFFASLIYLGLPDALAALGASVAGPLFNFLTTGKLVFDQLDSRRLPRFLGVYASLYFLAVAELRVGRMLDWSPYFTGAVATLPNALLGFVLMKKLVFASASSVPANDPNADKP
jgi:putative flippase GtrA